MQTTRVPGGVGLSSGWTVGPKMWAFVDYCRSKGDDVVVEMGRDGKATLTITFSDEEDSCLISRLVSYSISLFSL
jgi:hypothetical protein